MQSLRITGTLHTPFTFNLTVYIYARTVPNSSDDRKKYNNSGNKQQKVPKMLYFF